MIVTIKTLQQKQISVEVEPTQTILELKTKIGELSEAGSPAVERQKLIYSGKILNNEQEVASLGFKEGDFIVLMITNAPKPKPVATPAPVAATPPQSTSHSTPQPITASAETGGSALVTGAAYEEAISGIVEMGFGREEAIRALRASFNNPDRAVEYLTNGFPATEETNEEEEGEAGGEMEEDSEGDEEEEQMTAGERSAALDFLRQDPQFLQLRALIQQNPQLLEPIIEQLGQSSPELFQLIQNHQEEFAQLMNETPHSGDTTPQGMHTIQLTEEEAAAVDRLVALGFDKGRVVEAYLACDKNEELAANFLLEHLGDDDF